MYCSSCGAESIRELKYCKRCGANLNPVETLASANKPRGLVWIVAFGIAMMMGLPMGGIAVVFERIPDLLEKGLPLWFLTTLAIISLLIISVATVLLSRLLSPLFKAYVQPGEALEAEKPKLSGRAPALVDAPRDSVPSVTEETTRSFEPLRREQNTH